MPRYSFSEVLEGFTSQECDRFKAFLESKPALEAEEQRIVLQSVSEALFAEANAALLRVLLLELHAAKLTGKIPDGGSEDPFIAFVLSAKRPEFMRHLDDRYPVLVRRLECVLARKRRALEAMVSRIIDDRARLASFFGMSCDRLLALNVDLGDTHDQGHAVAKLQFSGGALMYKPRPVELDVRFDAFLAQLFPEHSERIRVPKAMDCAEYGWCAFVEHRYCTSEDDVSGFYRKLGQWVAVLHLLAGVDIHCENLIAAGSVPVIVDPECLFAKATVVQDKSKGRAYVEAVRTIFDSVLRSGILPYRSLFEGLKGVDVSSMAASAGQQSSASVPVLVDDGTADARIAQGCVVLNAPLSQPCPKNVFLRHVDDISDGFVQTGRLLQELDDAGRLSVLLDGFRGCWVRDLYRPTQVYSEVKKMLWHPASLHDAEKARLRAELILNKGTDLTPNQVAREIEDLVLRDIPAYRSKVSKARIADALKAWRSSESETQQIIFRASILAADLNSRADRRRDNSRKSVPRPRGGTGGDVDRARRKCAEWAIRRLLKFSVRGSDGSSMWIGVEHGMNGWGVDPVDADFYNGLGGIAFALAGYQREATCGRVNAVDGVEEVLDGCLVTLRSMESASKPKRGGGFNGAGSRILAWLALHVLLGRSELLDFAVEHAETLSGDDRVGEVELDIISGEAGLIVPLIQLAEVTQDARWLATAASIGNRVAAAAILDERGGRWRSAASEQPLGGFAHGATGVGWSLARLSLSQAGRESDRKRWAGIAEQAFDFEKSLYDEEHGAWRDLRASDGMDFSSAWCHGGIGIAMAACDLYERTGREAYLDTLQTAVESSLRLGWHKRVNLCHGSLGMREMVSKGKQIGIEVDGHALEGGDRIVLAAVDKLMNDADQLVEELYVPGLMTGLSGIVHGMCRIHPESDLPNPLLMEAFRPCNDRRVAQSPVVSAVGA
ncbi:type 2 lanthipeptide synthetase LanM family protein [Oleiagrimonas citrea]|uniref:Type 2 lantipeptide synthetase LanM n=2 Tax=Oleiagrimonas citrea TaxID=1665687 RepID=A0A846ZKH9_9GAMM|nr:type 2 lantipeptide synthetase LanM [Oleiagrimonas citrea]